MKKTIVITHVQDGLLNGSLIALAVGHNGEEANLGIDDIETYLTLEKLRFNSLRKMVIEKEENSLRISENGKDITAIITYVPSFE